MTLGAPLDTNLVGNITVLDILLSLIILGVGFLSVRILVRGLARVAFRRGMPDLVEGFVLRVVGILLDLGVVVVALVPLHVDLTSAVVGFGVLGVVIGFALKDPLANVAAGVLLAVLRPFRRGDLVQLANVEGTVEDLGITATVLRSLDNRKIIVPSALVLANPIINFNAYATRRIDIPLVAEGPADVRGAMEFILEVLHNNSRVLRDPPPGVHLKALLDKAVTLEAQAWVATQDFLEVKRELLEALHERLLKVGLSVRSPK